MNIIKGDIWAWNHDVYVVIPINLEGVCGRGLAKQMVDKHPHLGLTLRDQGKHSRLAEMFEMDNPLHHVSGDSETHRLVLFPVKRSWRDEADLDMIRRSAWKLYLLLAMNPEPIHHCVMPMVGCGFGERKPEDVLPILDEVLEPVKDRVFLIEPSSQVFDKYSSSFKPGYRSDRSAVEANRPTE